MMEHEMHGMVALVGGPAHATRTMRRDGEAYAIVMPRAVYLLSDEYVVDFARDVPIYRYVGAPQ